MQATEQQKFECGKLSGADCTGACALATASKVVLTLGQAGSAFQLFANVGDVPSRRTHIAAIPSMAKVVTSGALEHSYVDCRGEPLCVPGEAGCVNSILDNCGACGGLNLLDPPEGVDANVPLLCDLTEAGCQCLEEWTAPNFAGTESCRTFSGCNNYDPVTGMPCHGFFSNKSPEDWQAEGRSYCKVSPDCPHKMSSQFDFAECVPPPTVDCAGVVVQTPMTGGMPAVDVCGVCGGD
eukprot:COSAG02_NODE_17934_length_970_cov_1.280138_1_plen_237_part_01